MDARLISSIDQLRQLVQCFERSPLVEVPSRARGANDILLEFELFNSLDWSTVTPSQIAGMMDLVITMSDETALYLLPEVLRSVTQSAKDDDLAIDVYETWMRAVKNGLRRFEVLDQNISNEIQRIALLAERELGIAVSPEISGRQ